MLKAYQNTLLVKLANYKTNRNSIRLESERK